MYIRIRQNRPNWSELLVMFYQFRYFNYQKPALVALVARSF